MIRRLLPTLLMAAALPLFASPARASCVMPPATTQEHLLSADVVFLGTVTSLRNMDRTAAVTVEEIWRGPALPEVVTVHGGPDDEGTASSVDRTFEGLGRYLFAVRIADGVLHDDVCSATQPWSDDLAELRPAEVVSPVKSTDQDGDGSSPPWPLIAGVALALIGTSWFAFRRKRA